MSEKASANIKTTDTKKANSSSQSRRIKNSQVTHSPVDRILSLQRTIGNQTVQRLFKAGIVQAKLRIGRPGDIYEQEADMVADRVMRMPDISALPVHATNIPVVQKDERDKSTPDPAAGKKGPVPADFAAQSSHPDFLKMRRPFLDRNAYGLWDQASALSVWKYNFDFFKRLGFDDDLAGRATNLTAPFAIDAQLKIDNPKWWEITDRELKTTSITLSIPVFDFGADFRNWKPLPFLQKKSAETFRLAVASVSFAPDNIVSSLGTGQQLPEPVRDFYEPRFGADFGRVRVHNDSRAAESAGSIDAMAFTVGNDVIFGAGQYSPETSDGKKLLAHELAHVVQQSGSSQLNLQRAPDDKKKRRDVIIIGEDWRGSDEMASVLSSGAFMIHAKSIHEVVTKLSKVDFPVGTLYIITHSAPTGELQFGTAEGTVKPADIAAKLKGTLSTANAPDVVDFRGCSVGASPKAMEQIRSALGAAAVVAGECFAVIDRSKPVAINKKYITNEDDITDKTADEEHNEKRRELFLDLLKKNADTFGAYKKCIINPGERGYFAAHGHFVAFWFNPDDTAEWEPGKSVCYKDAARETADPNEPLPASDHCRIITVKK
ncbi:MAG TPA: DUF4157 domain-containing protein [Dissulfurispiraceae bacterium]|nr:DUF4157 domain-containing protein [Dissulfurispiraceae bacterium]